MSDSGASSVRNLLAAMGLAAVSATPGCIFSVGNPAPPPIDAGPDDPDGGRATDASTPQHDAGPAEDGGASGPEDAGSEDAGPDAGPSGGDGRA